VRVVFPMALKVTTLAPSVMIRPDESGRNSARAGA
jgi:hypothetical protein